MQGAFICKCYTLRLLEPGSQAVLSRRQISLILDVHTSVINPGNRYNDRLSRLVTAQKILARQSEETLILAGELSERPEIYKDKNKLFDTLGE
jgi:hypothetical protein